MLVKVLMIIWMSGGYSGGLTSQHVTLQECLNTRRLLKDEDRLLGTSARVYCINMAPEKPKKVYKKSENK